MRRSGVNGQAMPPENSASERPRGRPFPPGVSGNPGGRPKGLREFREALDAAGVDELMLQVLVDALKHTDIRVRLEALDRVAAYKYGRPGAQESIPASRLDYARQVTPEVIEEAQRILRGEEEA